LEGPYSLKDGEPYLGVGFALRCFQRLSLPNIRYPAYALGRTAGIQEVRPARSSRTVASSPQVPNARSR